MANIDDIAMQSSCSNYDAKIIDDKNLPLQYQNGAHFAVKAAAYNNYLLYNNKQYQEKYEFVKSGTKIKYYVCNNVCCGRSPSHKPAKTHNILWGLQT